MTKSEYLTEARQVGDHWINDDPSRFALIPNRDGEAILEEARDIEYLIRAAKGAARLLQEEVLSELLELRQQKKLLFPIGFMWGKSVFEKISVQRLHGLLAEVDPLMIERRTEILQLPAYAAITNELRRKNLGHNGWKVLFSCVYASTNDINNVRDIEEYHIDALASLFQPNGNWADWVGIWAKRYMQYALLAIAEVKGDPNFGRMFGTADFKARGSRKAHLKAAHLNWFHEKFDLWLESRLVSSAKRQRLSEQYIAGALSCLPASDVKDFTSSFTSKTIKHVLEHVSARAPDYARSTIVSHLYEFGMWAYEESRDDRGVPHFTFDLSQGQVERFRRDHEIPSGKTGAAEVAARPMPQKFHHDLVRIITEKDFAWPKSLINNNTCRPEHWISWKDPNTGIVENVFCEVIPRILLLLLNLPLRSIQAIRLDSGEGDLRAFDLKRWRWQTSTSPLAGHWDKLHVRNKERGVLREINCLGGNGRDTITGLWINSNKTQDIKQAFDETSGYEIPWELADVIQNLAEMRAWQEKYNPVEGPLAFSDVPAGIFAAVPTERMKKLVPSRFYLFRYPINGGTFGTQAPPPYRAVLKFFLHALDELERRHNDENPDDTITLITKRDVAGAPRKAVFTVHGMRSSTITALYNAGAPIAVLSKLLAGHASILMTLKYAKFEPGHVNSTLTEARRKAISSAVRDFPNALANTTYNNAASMTAKLSIDGLSQMFGSYREPTGWALMDLGLCPNGGGLCNIGGPKRRTKIDGGIDKSPHSAVPGGPRNCVRCRFFMTGEPYLIALWGHSVEISLRLDTLNRRIKEIEAELESLRVRRRMLNRDKHAVPPDLLNRISVLQAQSEAAEDQRGQELGNMHATIVLIEQVREIADRERKNTGQHAGKGKKLAMLVHEEGVPYVEGRASHRFELTDAVVQFSRFYPSMTSADIERERNSFLDVILHKNGYTPISLAPLSAEEKQSSADALSELLVRRLEETELVALAEGSKTLAALGIEKNLQACSRKAIGKPLHLPVPRQAVSLSHP
ncbi:VPA1269 family protein [Tianweitania sp.]|uniref:VPA1269 family protein n=1 Tax=Tianweitania sp. TaxID=2021634 RepID=UPI0028A25893|nr:VPA1269 family protein [Tianweitania sp.]